MKQEGIIGRGGGEWIEALAVNCLDWLGAASKRAGCAGYPGRQNGRRSHNRRWDVRKFRLPLRRSPRSHVAPASGSVS
jgi:hypothetical protein